MEHLISSAYHPQTNGLDERMNQTLIHTLKKITTTTKEWDECIDTALYVYRIGVQDSSRFSPFFLLYNRNPRKAIDYELKTASDSADDVLVSDTEVVETTEDVMTKLLEAREEYHMKARHNIQAAQKRQKTYIL